MRSSRFDDKVDRLSWRTESGQSIRWQLRKWLRVINLTCKVPREGGGARQNEGPLWFFRPEDEFLLGLPRPVSSGRARRETRSFDFGNGDHPALEVFEASCVCWLILAHQACCLLGFSLSHQKWQEYYLSLYLDRRAFSCSTLCWHSWCKRRQQTL